MISFRSYLIGSDCVCWRIVKGFSKTGSGSMAELLSFCVCIFGVFPNGLTPGVFPNGLTPGVFPNGLTPGVELKLTLPNILFT